MSGRVVLCMKWGTLYGPDYVNVLFNAVRDHLDGPFRFVCLTDDAAGLAEGIEARPIPDLGIPPEKFAHGGWPKLAVFARALHDLSGRMLFIDLDSVITGSLEPMFALEGSFRAIGGGDGWRRGGPPDAEVELLSGVFAMDVGGHPEVLDAFVAEGAGAYARAENEQAYIEKTISDWAPWPAGWVVSFKRHLRRSMGADLVLPVHAPPEDARIVAFHGDPRPIHLVGRKGLWMDFPHSVRCPVDWLDAYWARYGG